MRFFDTQTKEIIQVEGTDGMGEHLPVSTLKSLRQDHPALYWQLIDSKMDPARPGRFRKMAEGEEQTTPPEHEDELYTKTRALLARSEELSRRIEAHLHRSETAETELEEEDRLPRQKRRQMIASEED